MSAYTETIAYLQGLEVAKGWDLGLERMRAALARRGHPERRVPALHVAGTNGKGSCAAMLESILRAAGHRTGLYTSPHLIDFAERIRAGGGAMPHEAIVDAVAALRADADAANLGLTHFEFATLIALEWFARIGVEVAVIEVGLGGRLDATNAVLPAVTAITSIARDHEEFLGDDLVGIAREKAGIAKPGVPLVVGPLPPDAEAAVVVHAREVGAPVVSAVRDATLEERPDGLAFGGPAGAAWDGLRIGLPGAIQRDNARVGLTTLACASARWPCPPDAVRAGLRDARWPGRFAVVRERPCVLIDGAHNPAGATALAAELPALIGPRHVTLVFAVMADKRWEAMLDVLSARAARVVATRVGRRGLDPQALAAHARARGVVAAVVEDPLAAVEHAVAATAPDGAVVIAGSLFLAGAAYRALGHDRLVAPWQGWDRIGTQTRP